MSNDLFDVLKVIAYLIVGTLLLAVVGGWALRRFGAPRK